VQNNIYKRLIGVPRSCPNVAISQELGVIPVEYKIQIKKLMEYHRIIRMTEESLTKKSIMKTEQIGSCGLLDDAYAILTRNILDCDQSNVHLARLLHHDRRQDLGDISNISRDIANFSSNFVAMATTLGRGRI